LGRVRKLLAKAEDPAVTAAEAELYNAKAAELIARHGIDAALLAATGQTRDECCPPRSVQMAAPLMMQTSWVREGPVGGCRTGPGRRGGAVVVRVAPR